MIYIVVLNWNSDQDTIQCIESLVLLKENHDFKIVICDNDSKEESYNSIFNHLNVNYKNKLRTLEEKQAYTQKISNEEKFILIRNKKNYGYAGGNNVGTKLALNQENVEFVWILNNDTVVTPNSLDELVNKYKSDINIGVCGSRLVSLENKTQVQGIGGIINPWYCVTEEVGSEYTIDQNINESYWESKIDYVIGASLFFSADFLKKVGLMSEDFFLYYEEVDICNRAKIAGYTIGIASKSIVFHQQGASTKKSGHSISDYYSIRNRVLIARKHYNKYMFTVKLRLFFLILKRFIYFDFKTGIKYFKFLLL